MQIGYSEETLWSAIKKQTQEVENEKQWLRAYILEKDLDSIEDCAKNIIDSCQAILENIEHLKGAEM
jgi:hypothetical protein